MLSPTARRAVEAYGGEHRWRNTTAIEATYSAWGWALRLKWQPPLRRVWSRFEIARPIARIRPIDRDGHIGVLDGTGARLEDDAGRIVASRSNSRAVFPHGRRLLWWDALDFTYFAAYAMWNYTVLPALLLRDDIEWRELAPDSLEATFPPHLPTHCRRQQFHFDPRSGLLLRHDYTAEVIGTWARAAHRILDYATWQGIPYASRRRVTPRGPGGRSLPGPLLVGIDVHEWRMVE